MKEAFFYKRINANTISCRLCHHFCTLNPGEVGICGVRENIGGKLIAQSYGMASVLNIDPIEKKPFFHFCPGSTVLSLGSTGCNFRCANCQNHEISQPKNLRRLCQKIDFITPERIVEEALGNDCCAIAHTYTEATVNIEYVLEIMRLAQEADLKNIWISNAYMSGDALSAIIPLLDAINIDLKSMDDNFYSENCQARLQPVLDNIIRLKQEQIHLEISTLIIPTLSDDIGMLEELADFIASELDADTPWHLARFFPLLSPRLKHLPETSEDIIYEAYEIAKEAGLKYVYVSNLPGDQKENTYCSKCGELAIRRMDQYIERLDNHGHCSACDRSLDLIEI